MLRRTRRAAIGSAVVLTVLALVWELWLAPTGRGTLALKALPLVLTLPGLWRGRLRSYRWASLLVWLYVLEALVRATSDRGAGVWLASLELLLALLMFAACAAQVRLRLRADRAVAAAAGPYVVPSAAAAIAANPSAPAAPESP